MSTRANPVVIGAFVTGALILVVIGLLVFGSGRFFTKVDSYQIYFSGSVDGLKIGAPVDYRGVRIGEVKEMNLIADKKTGETFVQVIIQIEREKARFLNEGLDPEETYQLYMKKGMRAQLRMQSVVTGMLSVALDLLPEVPPRLRAIEQKYPEIPTAPTDMETLRTTLTDALEAVRKMPIEQMVSNVNQILDGVNRIVNAADMKGTLSNLNATMAGINRLVANLDAKITPIITQIEGATSQSQQLLALMNRELHPLAMSLTTAADSASFALTQLQDTLTFKTGVPAELAKSMLQTSEAARTSLEQATATLDAVGSAGGEDSQLRMELTATLKEVRDAARSLRSLADYLEQHPEALLRGKGGN